MAKRKVFISHSSKDHKVVKEKIIDFLKNNNISTWYFTDQTSAGDDFEKKVREGLKNCDYFLVAVSKNAIDSDWVKNEVAWATSHLKGKIIPVLLDKSTPKEELHLMLCNIQHIDFSKNINEANRLLLIALNEKLDITRKKVKQHEPITKVDLPSSKSIGRYGLVSDGDLCESCNKGKFRWNNWGPGPFGYFTAWYKCGECGSLIPNNEVFEG